MNGIGSSHFAPATTTGAHAPSDGPTSPHAQPASTPSGQLTLPQATSPVTGSHAGLPVLPITAAGTPPLAGNAATAAQASPRRGSFSEAMRDFARKATSVFGKATPTTSATAAPSPTYASLLARATELDNRLAAAERHLVVTAKSTQRVRASQHPGVRVERKAAENLVRDAAAQFAQLANERISLAESLANLSPTQQEKAEHLRRGVEVHHGRNNGNLREMAEHGTTAKADIPQVKRMALRACSIYQEMATGQRSIGGAPLPLAQWDGLALLRMNHVQALALDDFTIHYGDVGGSIRLLESDLRHLDLRRFEGLSHEEFARIDKAGTFNQIGPLRRPLETFLARPLQDRIDAAIPEADQGVHGLIPIPGDLTSLMAQYAQNEGGSRNSGS